MTRQRGVALLTVLWLVGLLTLLVGGYSLLVRTEVQLARQQVQQQQARLLAEAGVALTLRQLLQPGSEALQWGRDGAPHPLRLEPGELQLEVRDASGYIDLNRAQRPLLAALLRHLEVPFEARQRLLDRILDWRDADDLVRLQGAERRDYLAEGRQYGPKNDGFERVDELLWVPGMDAALLARARPYLTLYSGRDGVNPRAASPAMLKLLTANDEALVADILAARRQGGRLGRLAQPTAGDSGRLQLQVRAQVDGGARAELRVVAELLPGQGQYRILAWESAPVTWQQGG